MLDYDPPLYRPPSEARSLIFQATLGCSHNRCAFCVNYTSKRFRVKKERELFAEIDWAAERYRGVRRVFLADGDALVLSTNRLTRILEHLKKRLPALERVTAYAGPKNFRNKTVSELKDLRALGLSMLYIGLESGDDEILKRIDKGCTADEMASLCAKPTEAGMDLSVTVILGLGGPRLSNSNAVNTGRLIDRIRPKYASALTLMLEPREPSFEEAFGDPEFRPLGPLEILAECRTLLDTIVEDGIIFHSNHASNYLPLSGTLQKDKPRLLRSIDEALDDPTRLRPELFRGL